MTMNHDTLHEIAATLSRIKWQADEAMKMIHRALERDEREHEHERQSRKEPAE